MSAERRAHLNVALARAYVSEAARMIMQPLACWDLLTPEQREEYLDACLTNLTRANHRLTVASEREALLLLDSAA